jgi:uncharacterized membrane protein
MTMNRIASSLLPLLTLLVPTVLCAQDKGGDKGAEKGKAAAEKVDFQKQVLPILEKRCMECHGTPVADASGKAKKPKGGVILDSKEGIMASKKGKLVVAKKSGESKMIEVISLPADNEDRMPPAKKGEPLAKEEIELLKKWIDEGATFGDWTGKKADAKGSEKPKDGEKPKEGDKPKGGEKPKGGDKGGEHKGG